MKKFLAVMLLIITVSTLIVYIPFGSASIYSITWNGSVSSEWNNPINWSPNRLPNNADDVFIPSNSMIYFRSASTVNSIVCEGSLTIYSKLFLSSDSSITNLSLAYGGFLIGPVKVTVTERLLWSGGTISNATLNIAVGAIAEMTSISDILDNATFNNYGTANMLSTNWIISSNGSEIINHESGVFNIMGDLNYIYPYFLNYGTVAITTASGGNFFGYFDNTGTVEVNLGNLGIYNGSSKGIFKIGINGTLTFTSSTYVLQEGSLTTGEGKVYFNSEVDVLGNFSVTGEILLSGNVTFHKNVSLGRLTMGYSGIVRGPSEITIADRLVWEGSFKDCTVNIASTAVAQRSNNPGTLDNVTFDNYGVTQMIGFLPEINSVNGSVFINHIGATFDVSSQGSYIYPAFKNYGTVIRSAATDSYGLFFFGYFENYGLVDIGKANNVAFFNSSSSGQFQIGINGTLDFGSGVHVLQAGSRVSGEGNFQIEGKVLINGDYASLGLDNNKNLSNLILGPGSVLSSFGTITITHQLTWSSGTIKDCTLNVAQNAVAKISAFGDWYYGLFTTLDNATFNNFGTTDFINSGSAGLIESRHVTLNNSTFNNFGTTNMSCYSIYSNYSNVTNEVGGVFNINSVFNHGHFFPSFVNYGTVQSKNFGSMIFGDFQNYGEVIVWNGEFDFNSFLNNQLLNIGQYGYVTSNNYTQSSDASLSVDLGTLSPTLNYGSLTVGRATLNGTFQIESYYGSMPQIGDVFNVINMPSETGNFSSISGLDLDYSYALEPSFNNQGLSLTVVDAGAFSITPNKGGNTGQVSVVIRGYGLSDTDVSGVKLVKTGESDIVGFTVFFDNIGGSSGSTSGVVIAPRTEISTTFDLTGKSVGLWDVVVELRNGTSIIRPNGFTIEWGQTGRTFVTVLGRSNVRVLSQQNYVIDYENMGNTNGYDFILTVTIPANTQYKISNPQLGTISFSDAVGTVGANGVYSELGDGDLPVNMTLAQGITGNTSEVIPIWIYKIPAYTATYLYLTLTCLDTTPRSIDAKLYQLPSKFSQTGDLQYFKQSGMFLLLNESIVNTLSDLIKNGNITDIWNGNLTGFVEANIIAYFTQTHSFFNIQPLSYLAQSSSYYWGTDVAQIVVATALAILTLCDLPAIAALSPFVLAGYLLLHLFGDIGWDVTFDELDQAKYDIYPTRSWDPNEKDGSIGFVSQTDNSLHYVQGEKTLGYVVSFENMANATASAQKVVIKDTLDVTRLDINSFELGPIQIGDKTITPPTGLTDYSTLIDSSALNITVKIQVSLNKVTGEIIWRFTSLDPNTRLPITDSLAGFLPPNIISPEGQGSVMFWITSKAGLSTGTVISNNASIIFDDNEPIVTNNWLNTFDNNLPDSQVLPLPTRQTYNAFMVNWMGNDIGSGIRDCSVFFSEDGTNYTLWLSHATNTSAIFSGQAGKTYSFYSIATDNVGNIEDTPTLPDTITTIQPQISTIVITVTQGANGVISPGTTAVNYGHSQTFAITPNKGFCIANIMTDAGAVTITSSTGQTVSFSNIIAAHTMTATFVQIPTAPTSSPTPNNPTSSLTPKLTPTPTPTLATKSTLIPSPLPTTAPTPKTESVNTVLPIEYVIAAVALAAAIAVVVFVLMLRKKK